MTSQSSNFATRDRLIIDRLWRMKTAAQDIINLATVEIPGGGQECDGTCSSCVIENICLDIADFAYMNIPECCRDQQEGS